MKISSQLQSSIVSIPANFADPGADYLAERCGFYSLAGNGSDLLVLH